jgi:hypothetical protein
MGEIINLRHVRKQRARAQREAAAEDNRMRFGLTKADKIKQSAETLLARRRLEANKRETPDDGA